MRKMRATAIRLLGSQKAVAGIEFSMILPIMLLLLIGVFDGANGFGVYTKTRFATATLAVRKPTPSSNSIEPASNVAAPNETTCRSVNRCEGSGRFAVRVIRASAVFSHH